LFHTDISVEIKDDVRYNSHNKPIKEQVLINKLQFDNIEREKGHGTNHAIFVFEHTTIGTF
jgi:hypothetical protein